MNRPATTLHILTLLTLLALTVVHFRILNSLRTVEDYTGTLVFHTIEGWEPETDRIIHVTAPPPTTAEATADSVETPPTTRSELAYAIAEADYLDTVTDLVGMTRTDRLADPHGLLRQSLEEAWDHCNNLDRADTRSRYLNETLTRPDIAGLDTRLLQAAVTHLCPHHKALLS